MVHDRCHGDDNGQDLESGFDGLVDEEVSSQALIAS
jgi:hypothetical protein